MDGEVRIWLINPSTIVSFGANFRLLQCLANTPITTILVNLYLRLRLGC